MDKANGGTRHFLAVDPEDSIEVVRGLASPVRLRILKLLHVQGPMNVNAVSEALDLPQSTIATNVQILERSGLIRTRTVKARKGHQKICSAVYEEIVISFARAASETIDNRIIEVAMPLGLYTSCSVSAPCGLCSTEGIIGLLDVPAHFLDPGRMKAALIWFGRGYVEYKFPNNAKILGSDVELLEIAVELSSEVPGTAADWPSDISLWVNDVLIGTWTSPGDFGDRRGALTPHWWKLEGSQYGKLKTWSVSSRGTHIDGVRLSRVTVADLGLERHHSIRLRLGIEEDTRHPGGINIFGRGFGNHDQDIVLRLHLRKDTAVPRRGRDAVPARRAAASSGE
jgi:predicted transcriptional regulator